MTPKYSKGVFYKTFSTITLVALGLQIATFSAVAYYMLFPLANRAADDFSSLILFSAEHWQELKPNQRDAFVQQVLKKHHLVLTSAQDELKHSNNVIPPYVQWLGAAISQHQSKPVIVKESIDAQSERWFWFDVVIKNDTIRFGFPYSRIGANPERALFITLLIALTALIITTLVLTKRLTGPIDRLYRASKSIGKGNWPEPIQAEGPKELIVLTKQFNKMSLQVQELLSNRTVLLAGIAHDLRTPLTQIHLALSMLPNDGGDPKLMQSIQQDLENINQLISEALNIATELNKEQENPSDPIVELDKVITGMGRSNALIELIHTDTKDCQTILYPMAFRRILSNLIGNAIRYGNNQPIEVVLDCGKTQTTVQVKDRGPGIDEALKHKVFQPFYRLDKTRNTHTGGSGLGLAIVRQLSDLHHWHIELKNRQSGGTNAMFIIEHLPETSER